jgi:hypothetical protein
MGGRGPAYRTSHGGHGLSVAARPGRTGSATAVPRPTWGAAPGGTPGTAPAKQGQVWWFVVARTTRRLAVGIRGEKPRARSPLYKTWVRPPAAQPPGPTGPGAFFLCGPTFAKVPLRAGGGPGRARSGGRPAWSCGESRGSPHKPRKGRRGKGGLPGVKGYAIGQPKEGLRKLPLSQGPLTLGHITWPFAKMWT